LYIPTWRYVNTELKSGEGKEKKEEDKQLNASHDILGTIQFKLMPA
jgi:hypothetical protein